GGLIHCCWECEQVHPLSKTLWRVFKELKIKVLCDAAIALLGCWLDTKIRIQRDTCTQMFTAALSTTAKLWKQPKGPLIDERIKMWYIGTTEYSARNKNEILPFTTTRMDLEGIVLSGASQ
ncbi:LORF2 protein, partial [Crocuta crocuta]